MVTGKCYQSNKRSYHQIRYQSNKLCKENDLSVIDEFYESYKRKYKTNGKSWYENEKSKKGTSWKSRLQFDIDFLIKQSKNWEEFLKKTAKLGYEIKHGEHIAFKPKDKQRFTRAKMIGEDYTEERQNLQDKIKEIDKDMQLLSDTMEQIHTVKKCRFYYKEYKANPSDKAFLRNIMLKSQDTKWLLQNLKNPIQGCLIQRIF